MPGSRWHVLPKDGGGHREELRISASIVAIFNHDSAQWCVPDPALYHALPIATSADGMPVRPRAPTMAPDAQLFIKVRRKRGGAYLDWETRLWDLAACWLF